MLLPKSIKTKGVLLSMRRAASEWARDGYVLSYPKSGRTWFRTMFGSMACSQFGLKVDNPMELQHFWKLSSDIPNIGFTHDDYPNLKFGHEVEVNKAHYRRKKVLLLTRDPRDVLVSYYFDAKNRMKVIDCDISTYLHQEKGSIDAVVAFYNAWARARHVPRDFLWVTYEDMHRDPGKVIADSAKFFGLPDPSDELLNKVVEDASFRNMRNAEMKDSFNHERLRPADPSNPESFKVRRGKVGGYVDYFSDEDIAYIDDYIDQHLDPYFACYFSNKAPDVKPESVLAAASEATASSAIAKPAASNENSAPANAANDNRGGNRWKWAATVAVLFASGWMSHDLAADFSSPAAAASVVDEAQEAYVASRARQQMVSQIESSDFDRGELLAATGIDVPELPESWTVTDAQVYPSDLGNSVMVSLVTTSGDEVSLFAAEEESTLSDFPEMDVHDGLAIAYWEEGPMVVALVGEMEASRLLQMAADLADNT
ncbi:sulfotransferase domain-containing protein [Aurantiacibacter rhizosphaerae]|uniref:Sulfotransferase domain-containing protein n=1 Tax=Aurantiacibacter rhizosphaerae TaxID=2691582 RepID=A0A844XEW5_9SPHN|nr:sulfotransferase domain-containing protein [Aurantiacibacter rhizosphaerae]MWV28144.1 hypothetical protein [Aurantiacibacter rhizosphaerae]